MFKKTEESEWTRFSRALGGQPAAPTDDDTAAADAPEEAVTLAQTPAVEPEDYAPPPPPTPTYDDDPPETSAPAYAPSPQPVAAPAFTSTPARSGAIADDETVVGDGASIEGTIRSERSIRVYGSVQGEIESKQRVVIEEAARVAARITGEQVTVLGEVNGSIECSGRLEIASSARVTGEVSATTLVIQEGAVVEGNLRMSSTRDSS